MSQENQEKPNNPSIELILSPECPPHHLLSVKHNPEVKNMTQAQLADLVKRIQTLATSPQTMTSALQRDSGGRKPKVLTAEEIKRKELLASL